MFASSAKAPSLVEEESCMGGAFHCVTVVGWANIAPVTT